MIDSRCRACGDPCNKGWDYCLHCHAYNDLYEAFRWRPLGLNEHRLQRARAYIAGRRYVEPLESLLRKLTRRVEELENAAIPNMNDRLHGIECAAIPHMSDRVQRIEREMEFE